MLVTSEELSSWLRMQQPPTPFSTSLPSQPPTPFASFAKVQALVWKVLQQDIINANDVSDLNSDNKQETQSIGDGGGAKKVSWWNRQKDDIYRVRSADLKQLQPDPRQGNIRICLVWWCNDNTCVDKSTLHCVFSAQFQIVWQCVAFETPSVREKTKPKCQSSSFKPDQSSDWDFVRRKKTFPCDTSAANDGRGQPRASSAKQVLGT